MGTPCFKVEDANKASRYLRRYRSKQEGEKGCPAEQSSYSYHHALNFIDQVPMKRDKDGIWREPVDPTPPEIFTDFSQTDERWPTHCKCGYQFTSEDTWQVFHREIVRRADNGEEFEWDSAPGGAMRWCPMRICSTFRS